MCLWWAATKGHPISSFGWYNRTDSMCLWWVVREDRFSVVMIVHARGKFQRGRSWSKQQKTFYVL